MKAVHVERTLWAATVIAMVFAVSALESRPASPATALPVVPRAAMEPRQFPPDSLTRASAYVMANDPFRLSHQPATVAYSPALEGLAPSPVARAPRPNFVLRGVVGGPPWSAIIDGIPGRDGSTVVRKGDSVAAFVVRAVGRDTVTIKGADTTWQLTAKRP